MIAAGHAGLRKVHFVGVCGTAMGSLAAALRDRGVEVTGSDENVYPPMSTFLRDKGVAITAGFDAENLPADADCATLSAYLMAVMHGMAVQAKAGFAREALMAVAEQALKAWPRRA